MKSGFHCPVLFSQTIQFSLLRKMEYFVVNRFQIARMRSIVHDIDAQAFISITEVSDLFGKNAK